jgi:hypothetical protein
MSSNNLISSLCRTNLNILKQKVDLIKILEKKHGIDQLQNYIYKTPCPIIQASIGQHIRHSMDHIERVTNAISINLFEGTNPMNRITIESIQYDIRNRNTDDEQNVTSALDRMERVKKELQAYRIRSNYIDPNQKVFSCFMLSGTSTDNDETALPSTIARELGFVAHHAIHHLAMIKLIVTNPNTNLGSLDVTELPPNFGLAPSTIHHDRQTTQRQW